ncbi:hypothetical protein [Pseudoalteromonas lipolytica]|uniref:hypothetical protein n=1 Tax=Pseudoalteromonas lipolytica TaxID=570156 RepID=UPI00082510F1|nr:hypothetical protein [Pseudoalteromonas lipolytica]
MELNRLSFNPRKRDAYETFDLTVLLVKSHFFSLFFMYLCMALPLFIIVGVLLNWSWSAFLIWWLKPLFERPILDYMSKAVFNQPVSISHSLKSLKQLKLAEMLVHLSVLRFSPNRAFLAPVEQLEQLSKERKAKRKQLLFASTKPKQTLWMLFCVHFEFILLMGFSALTIALVPYSFTAEEAMYQIFEAPEWLEIAFNALYIVSIALVAPLFVTGGFLAYLHRRVELEGWDIELAFKNIRARLSGVLCSLALLFLSSVTIAPSASYADEIDKQQVKDQVTALYNEPNVIETETTWTPIFEPKKASSSDLSWLFNIFKAIGQVFGVLGWVLVALLVIWLVYYLMKKRGFFANLSLPERARHKEEPVIPSLFAEIKAQDLPTDLIASALRCFNAGQHRLALAYLLHYSLSWAQQQHQVRLHRSMTERECKRAIDAKVPTHIHDIFTRLFTAWVSVAWGHQTPDLDFIALTEEIKAMTASKEESTHEA